MPISSVDGSQIYTTFAASVRSVGTACTLAAVGIYLHRRGFVVGEGKKTLALISQQVTIPLFLFTKVIYCNQDWSTDPCPDIVQSLGDVWMLLLWPAYVVGWGLIVGYVGAKIAGTPKSQLRSVLAACAFSNSTGLPITLLTVVHTNFPDTTELGRIDPTLFLSVYLLTYPMLQWSIGGWLLAPAEEEDLREEEEHHQQQQLAKILEDEQNQMEYGGEQIIPIDNGETPRFQRSTSSPFKHNVLNNKNMQSWYRSSRVGMMDTDASLYISETDLKQLGSDLEAEELQAAIESQQMDTATSLPTTFHIPVPPTERSNLIQQHSSLERNSIRSIEFDSDTIWDTLRMILTRVFQPPVIGAAMGIFVAAIPSLRGVFVDIVDRSASAPLQWMFDALYSVGLAAVPLNMMILGVNLSQSQLSSSPKTALLSSNTMGAIVIGKMLVMPMIGVASALFCKAFLWEIPDDIDASFYLVLMIVFITPTANNVMVLVELSGGAREGIARVIAWEYAAAPIMLSLTMTTAVGVASQWS